MDDSSAVAADPAPPGAHGRYTFGLISDRRTLIGLFIAVALLYWMALYLYVPTLPTYAQSKTESLAMVGVILAQYGLWQAIIRLPIGIGADWLGRRKPFLIIGLTLCGLGAWVMGAASGSQGLLVGRALSGLGAGTWVPLIVVFSSLFPPEEAVRATAILSAIASVGRTAGTVVTGSLNELGGYSLAFNLAAITAAVALVLALVAREKIRPPRPPSVGGLRRLVTRGDVLLPCLLAALMQYIVWAVSFSFMPLLADQLGATDVTQSMLLTLHVVLVAAGSFAAAALVKRTGSMPLVYLTVILLVAGTAVTGLASTLAWIFFAQVLVGLARGVSYPVFMGLSIQDVDDVERTTAMGLHQSIYAIGMFAGPWISGILADNIGIRPMLGVTAVASLAFFAVLVWVLPQRRVATA